MDGKSNHRDASRIAEYRMTIKYRSGKMMEHVDFLSRYIEAPEERLEDRMTIWTVSKVIKEAGVPTVDQIRKMQKEEIPKWGKGFALQDGTIFF